MYHTLNNGEKVFRSWFVYSISKDAVYCFICKLFSSSTSKFAISGCSNWIHSAKTISGHEKSQDHFHSMHQFLIQRNSSASSRTSSQKNSILKLDGTICRHNQRAYVFREFKLV